MRQAAPGRDCDCPWTGLRLHQQGSPLVVKRGQQVKAARHCSSGLRSSQVRSNSGSMTGNRGLQGSLQVHVVGGGPQRLFRHPRKAASALKLWRGAKALERALRMVF